MSINISQCCQKVLTHMNKEKLNDTSLPEKKYNHGNLEDITDADYTYAKRVCKDFEIKKLCKNHNLYVQSDALLLVDVFNNFQNMCVEIYQLDPANFLSAPRFAWQVDLKCFT